MTTLQTIFLKEKTFENFSDAAVLEFMLTTAGIRADIPTMLTNLLDAFGSYKAILEARPEQLLSVKGITKKTATLISMVVPLSRFWQRCSTNNDTHVGCSREAEAFCQSLLLGKRNEEFFTVALNAQCTVLGYRRISEGSLSEVSAYPRIVMETALNYNAHSVLLCHNHPGGTCAPSQEDIASTLQLQRLLNGVDIMVLDHIIVAGDKTYSMIQHGDIDYRRR